MISGNYLSGVKTVVLGLGKTGFSCAEFLLERGASVSVSDSCGASAGTVRARMLKDRGAECFAGGDCLVPIPSADLVVASPGVPGSAPQVEAASSLGIPVVSELELFSWFCRSPVIGITGTNGKTTTAFLLSRMLNSAGFKTVPAGNFGLPLTGLRPESYDGSNPVVCEISSFQLEHTFSFRPFVSVILNITPDHMDRYSCFEEYVEAKRGILLRQTESDYAVINMDCPGARRAASGGGAKILPIGAAENRGDGVFMASGVISGRLEGRSLELDLSAAGFINPYNIMALAACALIYGIDSTVVSKTLAGFRGLEHRREFVAEISGVGFYNDSKATNAESFLDGIRSFGENLVIIAGGKNKGLDYSYLREEASRRVKAMVLIGETSPEMAECFRDAAPCYMADTMQDAVRTAFTLALPGDKVVLLPGTSSFDMFRDYEDRGSIFKEEVSRLPGFKGVLEGV